MTTPIIDFIKEYEKKSPLRLHTPGHKGRGFSGFEKYDITELYGADELFSPSGIIAESEKNATEIFGCPTYYSAEGSSLCVRSMIYLFSQIKGKTPVIAASRNAHKSFLYGVSLCGADVVWIPPHEDDTYVSVTVEAEDVKRVLDENENVGAVFITTPDYLGKSTELKEISDVCKKHGALLLVDGAHGAYLRFTDEDQYQYADIYCTSAHKTLPALTGAAYLHVRYPVPTETVKAALSAFASTSPSYLILASLDGLNPYLLSYKERLSAFIPIVKKTKEKLKENGFVLYGNELMKITLDMNKYGYTGYDTEKYLVSKNIYPEYADKKFITFMISVETGADGLDTLCNSLLRLPRKAEIYDNNIKFKTPEKAMSIRDAFFSQKETLPTGKCGGRILSDMNVCCPPAVCPVVCGETVSEELIPYLINLGIDKLSVVR